MIMFTTRPLIQGTFGVCTSTHWIASAVGFGILERGGNAFDATVAMGLVLQVVEPHLCGPGGDVPIIFQAAGADEPMVLCGQGVAPAAATIEAYTDLGLDLIPGSGLLATVIPGAFDAWLQLLRDHGSMPLRDVLAPTIHYAEAGHPLLPAVADVIAEQADFFAEEWPTSFATWCPSGQPPVAGTLFRNETLAATWKRILAEAESVGGGREQQIEAARHSIYRGFVAEEIDRFCRSAEAMDSSGARHKGLLTADDMANWQASYEPPLSYDYQADGATWTVCKTGPWGQGPVFLQCLSMLPETELTGMGATSADFIHIVVEAMKLAFADREAYYGDPDVVDVPIKALLDENYARARSTLIEPSASLELRPGLVPGFEDQVRRARDNRVAPPASGGIGAGEPTMAHLTERPGDTVHIDVIDRFGNMVSATPSGGWLQSSPVIPKLGFPLNSRAQMFWLRPDLPTSLAPGKRPRTTLTPSLVKKDGRPSMVFGTPGGDQQDQWQLILFLRRVCHGLNLQEAIDLPLFHTSHFPSSFYPRGAEPGHLMIEASVGDTVISDLRGRGHHVEVADPWTLGRLTAAERSEDGILKAAATPRLMQAYAVGR
ncbi:MAG: gamma-glutamyltransferase family protein [Geminicoccaceae bacterium]